MAAFRTSAVLAVALVLTALTDVRGANIASSSGEKGLRSSLSSIYAEDIVVASTLTLKPRKAGSRQGRTGPGVITLQTGEKAASGPQASPLIVDGSTVLTLKRNRRSPQFDNFPQQFQGGFPQQFQGGFPQQGFPQQQFQGGFPQQQFQNPGAFSPFRRPNFSASNAQAQAQAFESNSPFGGFGAAAANAGSQGFGFDENGFRANAGLSGSQSYHLPNGNTLALSYANGFSVGPDGKPTVTRGNSLAYTGADGKPVDGFRHQ